MAVPKKISFSNTWAAHRVEFISEHIYPKLRFLVFKALEAANIVPSTHLVSGSQLSSCLLGDPGAQETDHTPDDLNSSFWTQKLCSDLHSALTLTPTPTPPRCVWWLGGGQRQRESQRDRMRQTQFISCVWSAWDIYLKFYYFISFGTLMMKLGFAILTDGTVLNLSVEFFNI